MIEHTLDATTGILHIRPGSPLEQTDFERLAREVDPFIAEHGDLAGLIVEIAAFPGWESFGAMCAHFRFARDHHKHIRKIALVTDSPIGTIGEKFVAHFVAAEIKQFPASALAAARQWILS